MRVAVRDTRYESALFTVTERLSGECALDTDGDGLLDRWEEQVGLDPTDPGDALGEEDNDGLKNRDEFVHGTDPFNPDSDFGGESDGSEVSLGRDPVWERDDQLPRIEDYGVVRGVTDVRDDEPPPPGTVLRFPASTEYQTMHIHRASTLNPDWSDFVEIAAVDVRVRPRGLYRDMGAAPHVKQFYYLQAEGLSGALTPPTDVFSAVTAPPELLSPGATLNLRIGATALSDGEGGFWYPDEAYLTSLEETSVLSTSSRISTDLLSDRSIPLAVLSVGSAGELRYAFSVPNGPYTVTLYFSEICSACVSPRLGGRGCSTCKREFLVAVEDQGVVYNPADAVVPPARDGIGKLHVATELVFEVEVTDAALNIDLADSGTGSQHPPLVQALSIRNDSTPRSLSILRGDCNDDGAVHISDGICTLNWLFPGKGAPVCFAAPDSNGDRVVDISDATYTLSHLFLGGPAPVPPFPACGRLPVAEESSCAQ